MKIVTIGAAPTALGLAYRLNELKNENAEEAKDVELLMLEQVLISCFCNFEAVFYCRKHFLVGCHVP